MSVETQIQAQVDNLAAYKQALIEAVSGRTNLWGLVDAAADQPYEDAVKGATVTALDATMNGTTYGSFLGTWFSLHFGYFRDVLGLSGPNYFESAFAGYGWRVSQRFNEIYYDVYKTYLSGTYVFPAPDLALGTFAHTGDVFASGSDAIDTAKSGAGIVAVKVTGSPIGGANLGLTLTLTKAAGGSLNVAISIPNGSAVGTVVKAGEQAVGGATSAGQPVIAVSATSQFVAGERVLVVEGSTQEVGTVSSVSTNASITLSANLKHAYTASGKVYPLFVGITDATATSGTNGDAVSFVTVPDRTVSL